MLRKPLFFFYGRDEGKNSVDFQLIWFFFVSWMRLKVRLVENWRKLWGDQGETTKMENSSWVFLVILEAQKNCKSFATIFSWVPFKFFFIEIGIKVAKSSSKIFQLNLTFFTRVGYLNSAWNCEFRDKVRKTLAISTQRKK